jgi:rhodanese-related sulfurtransferase
VNGRTASNFSFIAGLGCGNCVGRLGCRVAGEIGGKGYTDITVDQLPELLEEKDTTLVNVHIPYKGEIPQTDLFIPFEEIADHTGELPDKGAAIVLYCLTGPMSETAEALISLGYTNVKEVDGGMRAWEATGYELLFRR